MINGKYFPEQIQDRVKKDKNPISKISLIMLVKFITKSMTHEIFLHSK